MRRRRSRSLPILLVLVGWVVASPVPIAGAHAISQTDAKHYETKIAGVEPAVPGLTAAVDPRGDWIEVRNATSRVLLVLGYAGEPYLRIDATGVQENSLSLSAQLNQGVVGDVDTTELSRSLPPAWHLVSTGQSARWHDLRIHWGNAQRPEEVRAHPDRGQLIARWTVHLLVGARPVQVKGTLRWLPIAKTPVLGTIGFVLDGLVIALGVVAVVWWYLRRRARGSARQSVEAAGSVSS